MAIAQFQHAPTQFVDVYDARFAHRDMGFDEGTPLILLNHLTAVLDDWDPRVVDGLAAARRVIAFDNRGIGASEGKTPTSVDEMARDAVAFIRALGCEQVDLLGFSLGGFVSQVIAQEEPDLVRKVILAGTGPAGGVGIEQVGEVLFGAIEQAEVAGKNPKQFLFFTQTVNGQQQAAAFLKRLDERVADRDTPIAFEAVQAQVEAIGAWGRQPGYGLQDVKHPVFIANGDDDIMVPTENSFEMLRRLPNVQLAIFPDAGHGGIFQYHEQFVRQALAFLQ
jgi:pimeloyl-ACP methyl ester carboxylesterase